MSKMLRHWLFKLDISLRYILFSDLALEAFHRFHQVFCVSFTDVQGRWSELRQRKVMALYMYFTSYGASKLPYGRFYGASKLPYGRFYGASKLPMGDLSCCVIFQI